MPWSGPRAVMRDLHCRPARCSRTESLDQGRGEILRKGAADLTALPLFIEIVHEDKIVHEDESPGTIDVGFVFSHLSRAAARRPAPALLARESHSGRPASD